MYDELTCYFIRVWRLCVITLIMALFENNHSRHSYKYLDGRTNTPCQVFPLINPRRAFEGGSFTLNTSIKAGVFPSVRVLISSSSSSRPSLQGWMGGFIMTRNKTGRCDGPFHCPAVERVRP